MKILLLNPPADRPLLREYYCSKLSKGNYLSEPIDLVIQSAILGKDHNLTVLDCVVDNFNDADTIEFVKRYNFEVILFLSGSISYLQDFHLIEKIKNLNSKIFTIGSGDIFMEQPERILHENIFIDAILLDFTSDGLLKVLNNEFSQDVVLRENRNSLLTEKSSTERDNNESFIIPVPHHELFPLHKYTYPVIKRRPFATVLTEYGCAFNCKFCIMNKLLRKKRPIENIKEELIYLKKLGVKELFIIDQTFGVGKKDVLDFCDLIKDFQFSWFCFSRADVMDYEKLKNMKYAGCHTVMLGVESGKQDILDINSKNINLESTKKTFSLCKKLGIRTLATFILGLPGESYDSCLQTIEFAKNLPCDFVSFNIATPRMATAMRKEAIENGTISEDLKYMDQSGSSVVSLNEGLDIEQLIYLQRKGYLEFYLRPRYLLNKILSMRSFTETFIHFRDGYYLLRQIFSNFKRNKVIIYNKDL